MINQPAAVMTMTNRRTCQGLSLIRLYTCSRQLHQRFSRRLRRLCQAEEYK